MDKKKPSLMGTALMMCTAPGCLQRGRVMEFEMSEELGKYYGFLRLTCSCGCVTAWEKYPLMNASIMDMSKAIKAAIASRRQEPKEVEADDQQQTRESTGESQSE